MDEKFEFEVLFIDEHDIGEYVYAKLIEMGYAPTSDEALDLAQIFFDYLVEKGVMHIDEIEFIEDEEEE